MGNAAHRFQPEGRGRQDHHRPQLGAALARRGHVPLLVDLDAQSRISARSSSGSRKRRSLFAYYNAGKPLKDVVRPNPLRRRAHSGAYRLIKVDTLFGGGRTS